MNEPTQLSDKQLARAEALKIARSVLSSSSGFAKSDAVDPIDLVSVARFVLTGDDPWATDLDRIKLKGEGLDPIEISEAIARAQSDGAA